MGGVAVMNETKTAKLVVCFTFLYTVLPTAYFAGTKVVQPGQYAPFSCFCGHAKVRMGLSESLQLGVIAGVRSPLSRPLSCTGSGSCSVEAACSSRPHL